MKYHWVGLILIAAALLASGCSDFVDHDQVHASPESQVTLRPDHPLGQTLVARHGGLNGIDIWLDPTAETEGQLYLRVRAEPDAEEDLVTATLQLTDVTVPGFHRFPFSPLRDSHGSYYYATVEMDGRGEIGVGAGPGDAYQDGALYHAGEPQDAQMSFRLVYSPRWIAFDVAGAVARGLGLLGVTGLLYVVPGWALLAWLGPKRLSWAEMVGLAAGVSLALYPLLFLWTDLLGLYLGPLYAWGPVLCGVAALIWRYRDWRPMKVWASLENWARSDGLVPDMTLLIVMGLVFAARLLVVRTLDAPMWGDSYQHTMITQLLVDNGGLFDSWEPYAGLHSFTYHFGFHTAMAAWHWVTGATMANGVLWGAQILNGLAVMALYPLAVHISGSRWAGVGAVLVTGLLSPMPMSYVNWGRYTQLAGQVVLPAAVVLSWRSFEAADRHWRLLMLAWLAVGGLALTHYRVLIFYVVFVLAWIPLSLGRIKWQQALERILWVGTGSALLFLPWFAHIVGGRMATNFGHQLTTAPAQTSAFAQQYNRIGNLTLYLGPGIWLLAAVAAATGLWRRRRRILLLGMWFFLLFIATNPALLGLPGSGAISNFAVFIAAYIPAALFIGDVLAQVMEHVVKRRLVQPLAAIAILVIGLWGVRERMHDVRPREHALVTHPDMRAMAWIRENTCEDSRFLVNSFFAYGGSAVVGSDAGWWIPLLAERDNTVPPLNYTVEQSAQPGYREWVSEMTAQIQKAGMADRETAELLKKHGITHVYLGQKLGRVNYGGPHVLAPGPMVGSEWYRPVYRQDRVWVFEVES